MGILTTIAYDENLEGDPDERLPLIPGVVLADPDLRPVVRVGQNSIEENCDGERADVLTEEPVGVVADAQERDELVDQDVATDHRLL